MIRWPIVAMATALVSFVSLRAATPAAAQDLQIAGPVASGNLGVYFVDGQGPGGPAMVTLDEGMAQGTVKIFQQKWSSVVDPATHRSTFVNGPVAIQNMSATQSLFIQVGDLVRGGLQDQVVIRSTIIPPLSTRVSIDTLCVDPFRSTARIGDNADLFSAPAALFPWRLAKLGALANNSASTVNNDSVRDVRQLATWWSIDSLRARLSQKLGVPLEPAAPPSWTENHDVRTGIQLEYRHRGWTNSLPLSLENPQLARAEQPFIAALADKAGGSGIIGAVFVINGQIEGADIYRSHALFQQEWPKLLRAYAAEAIADAGSKATRLPTVGSVHGFLAAAEQAPSKVLDDGNIIHENNSALYAVTSSSGAWVYRSYVAKHPADATSPEGLLVRILETGTIAGHQIADLTGKDMIVLHQAADGRFTAVLETDPTYDDTSSSTTVETLSVTNANASPVTNVDATTFDARWSMNSGVLTQPVSHGVAPVGQVRSVTAPSTGFIDVLMLLVMAVAGLVLHLIWRKPSATPSLPKVAAMSPRLSRHIEAQQQQPALAAAQRVAAKPEPVQLPTAVPAAREKPAAEPPISLSAYRRRLAAKAASIRSGTTARSCEPAGRVRAA